MFKLGNAAVYDEKGNWYGLDVTPRMINGKYMIPAKFIYVDVADNVTVGKNNVILGTAVDEVIDTYHRLESCGVKSVCDVTVVCRNEGRENFDTSRATGEIPVLTCTDMIHK